MRVNRIPLLVIVALVAGLAGLGSYLWLGQGQEQAAPRRIDFSLTDLDGELRQASEWDGKVVLINFWAPWCEPCRAEIPLLVDLQQRHAAKGFQVLGPALDNEQAVRAFAHDYGINYPLFTELNAVMDLQEAYGDTRLPYTVLLDRQGRVAYTHAGELQPADIEAQISKVLIPRNPL